MKLKLERLLWSKNATCGLLSLDGEPFGVTLEDKERAEKVHGRTAIPKGCYKVAQRKEASGLTRRYRARYDWFTWHFQLQDVPGFNYVYIHIGNYHENTEGCILVGEQIQLPTELDGDLWISNSKNIFQRLYIKMEEAAELGEEIEIEIV